ncbi:MAG: hypothetical protein IMY80_06070, partial [Chloroflexi bacterium]|nr:hypothetical protein [Chloroflexota bacterium]
MAALILLLLFSSGCSGAAVQTPATETKAAAPSTSPHNTSTAEPPTLPPPTPTSPPPTAYPLPTLIDTNEELPSITVCAAGCSYRTLQAAIDAPGTNDSAIIEIRDPIHSEAGIVVNKSVTIRGLGPDETIVQASETPEDAPDRVFY